MKINFILIILQFICFIKAEEFIGCYKYDLSNMEFTISAPHLDPTLVTPSLCVLACESMGYGLSTILQSEFCVCKIGHPIISNKVDDSICFRSGNCKADNLQYCGNNDYILVYGGSSKITVTPAISPSANVPLFSNLTYKYVATDPAQNVIFKIQDRDISGYKNLTGDATINFIDIGFIEIEASGSGNLMKDTGLKKVSFFSPNVEDMVSSFNFTCPTFGPTDEYFTCDLKFDKGTNTILDVDYNDGTTESIKMIDSEFFSYGISVPQSYSKPSFVTLMNDSSLYLLYNTFFHRDGYLRGIEFFTESGGQIEFKILAYSPCSSTYSEMRNPTTCTNYYESFNFKCTNTFSKLSGHCSSDDIGVKSFIGKASTDFTVINSQIVNVVAGYNFLKLFDNFEVKQGWFIGLVQISAKIAIDDSDSAKLFDYNSLNPILSISNKSAFYVRAFVSRPIFASSYKFYKQSGNYGIKATIKYPLVNGVNLQSRSNFTIYEKITGLKILVNNSMCLLNRPCNLTAIQLNGSQITYNWVINNTNTITTLKSIAYTFKSLGTYEINLFASNAISNSTFSTLIMVVEVVSNPLLHSYSQFSISSASVVLKNAEFLFTLQSGTGYICLIEYGDSSSETFDDIVVNYNSTKIRHFYINEGVFTVTIKCSNPFSSASYMFQHTVQQEISDLKLLENGAFRNTPFNIKFSLARGSNVTIELFFNGLLDNGVVYDTSKKIGISSSRVITSSGMYNVSIKTRNLVSECVLNQLFEIGSMIRDPTFKILTNGISNLLYNFGTKLDFEVHMTDGANVRLKFYFGEESDPLIPSNDTTIPGDWNNKYFISYTHLDPGGYNIYVQISNAFQSFVISHQVSIATTVNNLIPGLVEDPVVYSPLGSFAYFKFSYSGDTKSGSQANVTFWPGDLFNASFGPYSLGMNFKLNSTTNRLMYKYQSTGVYRAVFFVENILGSKYYDYTFEIRDGVSGLFINFPSVVRGGDNFKVETYLIFGTNVQYTWSLDSNTHTARRNATSVSEADFHTFNTSTERNSSLVVKASDFFSAQILRYLIEIQNPVRDLILTTIPSNVSNLINRGTSDSRTVTFFIDTTGNPTNPFFTIDFGDGSPVASPYILFSRPTNLSYTYSSSGSYYVVITIFNKISSVNITKTVKILSDFAAFKCAPYWRPIPIDGTEEIAYPLEANNIYLINREKELRLHCSWANAFADIFLLDINGVIKNYTNMNEIKLNRSGIFYSCIIPFDSKSVGSTAIIPLKLTYSNSAFSRNFQIYIQFYSSVTLNGILLTNEALSPGTNYTYVISYQTLAEPSCALITLSTLKNIDSFTIGTNPSICSFLYPNVPFNQIYDKIGLEWRFTSILSQEGRVTMTANVKNIYSSQSISTNVTVTSLSCSLPLLYIANRAEYFYEPIKILRNKMITFLAESTLRCNESLKNIKKWNLYEVNNLNGQVIRKIDLSNNPSANFAEIVIDANFLNYGLYKFTYSVQMVGDRNDLSAFKSEIDNFVKIVPTGIIVFGLKGGLAELRLGMSQTLEFTPASYSFDQDSIVQISSLRFKFHCSVVDNGITPGYPKKNLKERLDLLTMKSDAYPMSNNATCFESSDDFKFDPTGNSMKISTSSLKYYKFRLYRFLISTQYLGEEYFQEIDLIIDFVKVLPIITLGCVPSQSCRPYSTYQKYNPNSPLMISGYCKIGCENVKSISYSFQIFSKLNKNTVDNAWIPFLMPYMITNTTSKLIMLNESHVLGSSTSQMVMLEDLFKIDMNALLWKVDLTVTIISNDGVNSGSSSLVLLKNQTPLNGSCVVSPQNGSALETKFKLICSDWYDSDGKIVRYEYFVTYLNNLQPIGLGFNADGKIEFELQEGPSYDNYTMYLYVEIVDDDWGITKYDISSPVTVTKNSQLMNNLYSEILTNDPTSSTNVKLFSGSPQTVMTIVSSITTMINNEAFLENVNQTTQALSFGSALDGSVNFDLMNNIPPVSYKTKLAPTSINETSKNDSERLNRSKIRDFLFTQLSNVSISDISSMKMWAGVLTSSTKTTDELSRKSSEIAANQCMKIANRLKAIGPSASLNNLKTVTSGIIGSMSSVITGLNSPLSGYSTFLNTDLENSKNTNNPGNLSEAEIANNLNQRIQLVDATQKIESVLNVSTNLLGDRLNLNQSIQISSNTIAINIKKLSASDLNPSIYSGLGKMNIPNFCDLINQESKEKIPPKNPFYTPPVDPNACDSKSIIMRTRAEVTAPIGFNGLNETSVQDSNSIGLDFLDENSKPISIINSKKPIDIWIPRNPSSENDFVQINITDPNLFVNTTFISKGIQIKASNVTVFIHLKPYSTNSSLGYFIIIRRNFLPIYNNTHEKFDKIDKFCPKNLRKSFGESYYQFFINNTEINDFKGFLGYGIREMNQDEYLKYCVNENYTKIEPLVKTVVNFTQEISSRIFTVGCFYYDHESGNWLADGVEVVEDSNLYFTHCRSVHLTTFAGGFIVLPEAINFENVWANASFDKNPTIYVTVIVISVLFVLIAIFARMADVKDGKKVGLNLLNDNKPYHEYCYELIVFTGNRPESGTESKVRFILSGEKDDTGVRCLCDSRRKTLRRGGVDSFIMAVEKPLGQLTYFRIWHDNSGQGDYASWYLKFIIVRDLQTKEKFYFLCERWFAVEKDDGELLRLLPLATDVQKTNLKYLAQKEAKEKLSDGHLWLSVVIRPAQSSFTRLDRVTCCFVLLYVTMLVNILYYGLAKTNNSGGLELGPFIMTPEQIGVAIITNLIIFPPTLLVIQLFRKSRRRITQLSNLEKNLNKKQSKSDEDELKFDDLNKKDNKKKPKKSKGLPWWCKIIAYILSFVYIGVSIFFIIVQGITLGDEKVKKWLTSFLTSAFTSIFLTQPIKITLTALVLILICRKSNDKMDLQHDDDEDDETFEKKKQLNQDKRYEKYRINFFEDTEIGKLTSEELNEARRKREKELFFWKIAKEVAAYGLFLSVLFIFSYSNLDPNSYKNAANLRKLFINEKFYQIKKIDEIWDWVSNDFAPLLTNDKWYNDLSDPKINGFIDDYNSRIIGYPTIRTNRVVNNSCSVSSVMDKLSMDFCNPDYSIFSEEKNRYGFNWTQYSSNYTPPNDMIDVYKAFQYVKSDDLDGLPYAGIYTTYGGGGYLMELKEDLITIQKNLKLLKQQNWVDRQTRTFFIELNLYNPNINLFCIITILFEILPSGNFIQHARFDSINLIIDLKTNAITVGFGILYLGIIIFFMVREILKIIKMRLSYFKQFWIYIQWLLISLSWTGFAMFIYRVYTGEKVKKFFSQTAGKGYIKLQSVNYWNEMLTVMIALCTCLATLKFLKLLRFNSSIIVLIKAFKKSFDELVGISFMLTIIFAAFIQIFFLIFNEKITSFSNIVKAAETCFQVLLGKFEVGPIITESPILGPLVFSFYNLIVLIIIVNVFISVVSDNFIQVKRNKEAYLIDNHMSELFIENIKCFINRFNIFKKEKIEQTKFDQSQNSKDLKKGTDLLSSRLNKILKKVNEFNKETEIYDKYLYKTTEFVDQENNLFDMNGSDKCLDNLNDYRVQINKRKNMFREISSI